MFRQEGRVSHFVDDTRSFLSTVPEFLLHFEVENNQNKRFLQINTGFERWQPPFLSSCESGIFFAGQLRPYPSSCMFRYCTCVCLTYYVASCIMLCVIRVCMSYLQLMPQCTLYDTCKRIYVYILCCKLCASLIYATGRSVYIV